MTTLPSRGERHYYNKIINWLLTSHNADGTIKEGVLDEIIPGVATQEELELGLGEKADQAALTLVSDQLTAHEGDTANPHAVTATQVGLGNANNTSDANKPVSIAQQAALDLKADQADLDATDATVGGHTTAIARVDPGASDITDAPDGSALVYEGDAPQVRKLGFWDVTWSGATSYAEGTAYASMTDSASAIATAVTKAKSLGVPVTGQGTFRVDSTVRLDCDADFRFATFVCSSTSISPLVAVGNADESYFNARTLILPALENAAYVEGAGWTGTSLGLLVQNANYCQITVPYINGFVTGFLHYGVDRGTAHNDLYLGELLSNKVEVELDAETGGWCNSNHYYGGGWQQLPAEGTNISGARLLLISAGDADAPNGNIFVGCGFEGNVAEFLIECYGYQNTFVGCRFEASGGPKVQFNGSVGQNNLIIGGNGANSLTVTNINSAKNNIVETQLQRSWKPGTGDSGPIRAFINAASSGRHISGMDTSATPATSTGSYVWDLASDGMRFKAAADANARIWILQSAAQIRMGPATTSQDVILQRLAVDVLGMGTGDAFRAGTFTTATRPSASSFLEGTQFYETDVDKPLWSNGTNWKEAADWPVSAQTGSFSASGDVSVYYPCNATSGAITATLPAASTARIGMRHVFKKTDATNNVVVTAAGSDTIDGAATKTITTQYGAVSVVCVSATAWSVQSTMGTIT